MLVVLYPAATSADNPLAHMVVHPLQLALVVLFHPPTGANTALALGQLYIYIYIYIYIHNNIYIWLCYTTSIGTLYWYCSEYMLYIVLVLCTNKNVSGLKLIHVHMDISLVQ